MDEVDRQIVLMSSAIVLRVAARLQALINEPDPVEYLGNAIAVLEGQANVLREVWQPLDQDERECRQVAAAMTLAATEP